MDDKNVRELRETERRYKEFLGPSLARLYKLSGYYALEVSAEGLFVYDEKGNRYLDCAGGYGVFVLGHRHPKVVAAVKSQLDLMPMSSKIFFNPVMAQLAEKLIGRCGGDLQYCFFCNSGAESVEGAVKIARLATGKKYIISTGNAFHGKTFGALSVSGRDVYKKGCGPLLEHTVQIPFNDADALERAITDDTAAFIVEPVQGEAGIVVPDDDYLQKVRKICTDRSVVFIADEIQSSMGRTGKFFAVENWNVWPDMMVVAKGLGGGVMPIGAIIATRELWEPFKTNPLIHTSTFGGNELACSAAIATLDVIEEEKLEARACEMGRYFKEGLEAIAARYPQIIAQVRGIGLMIGVELKEEKYGGSVIYEMARGKVTGVYTLNNQRVIRFEPALTIDRTHIDMALEVFEAAVDKTAEIMVK